MNIKQELYKALTTDTDLMTFFSNDTTKITEYFPDIELYNNTEDTSYFPRLTYNIEGRKNIFFRDNKPVKELVTFELDIWLPSSMTSTITLLQITEALDVVMINLGYNKDNSSDKNKQQEKIYSTSLYYTRPVNINN